MKIVPFPPELLDGSPSPKCFHDGRNAHVPCGEAYALVVLADVGELRAVCSRCMWRYCNHCNLDAHRCPHCGTVTDHFEPVCPEAVAEFATEERVDTDTARDALVEATAQLMADQ